MALEQIKQDLEDNGYAIVLNVLTDAEREEYTSEFMSWYNNTNNLKKMHNVIGPHGIFKFHEVGHQRFAWLCRSHPKVVEIFKYLWKTDKLVASFDGSCYFPKDTSKKDKCWTHTDQSSDKKGVHCYQGLVSLTSNKERTLVVYEGSHKLHEKYFAELDITDKNNFCIIQQEYINSIQDKKRVLNIPAGSLVIWDSRTFHQNQYGSPGCEERIVQYVSYLPKEHKSNSVSMQKKRLLYYNNRRTTTHWAYPIRVNSLQPQSYGNKELKIDYSTLQKPDLSGLEEKIKDLI
jgi:ectoine hydroxylase-related dioxygenase (phytanoyl-CoA dioxygenase family)